MGALANAALKYVGVPFKHHGRLPTGMDCIGLVALASRDAGYDVSYDRPLVYGRQPYKGRLQQILRQYLGEPITREIQVDDILLFTRKIGVPPAHLGIVTEHPQHPFGVVHASYELGKVVHHGLDDHFRTLVYEAFSWE